MTTDAPGAVYALIPKAMAEIGAIAKDAENTFDGYFYRGIDGLYGALHGPFSRLGLFVVPYKVDSIEHRDTKSARGNPQLETTIVETFRIYAKDGSYVECQVAGIGVDRGDKGIGKAHTGAFKTLMFEVFMPPLPDGSDAEKDSPTRAAGPFEVAKDKLRAWVKPWRDRRLDPDVGVSDSDFLTAVARVVQPQTVADLEKMQAAIEADQFDIASGKEKE